MKTVNYTQPLLAALALLAAVTIATGARAQAISITTSPNLGRVAAAGSGVTVFNFSSATGAVTKASGNGARVSTGTTNALITLSCNSKWCNVNPIDITVTNTGSPSGRAGPLTNFTATMGNAVLNAGNPSTPANPLSFQIQGMGGSSRTFTIGASFPIYGDDQVGLSTGAAASSFVVTMSDSVKNNSATPKTGTATATVFHQLTMGVANDPVTSIPMLLEFGRIVRPKAGTGTIAMPASTGTRAVSGAVGLSSPSPSRGGFTVTGEGGQTISVSVPTTIVVNNQGPLGGSITISTSNTAQGTQVLNGSLGGTGSMTFYVGGVFTIDSTTANGGYQGTYQVTASYN